MVLYKTGPNGTDDNIFRFWNPKQQVFDKLAAIPEKAEILFLGGVGSGKTTIGAYELGKDGMMRGNIPNNTLWLTGATYPLTRVLERIFLKHWGSHVIHRRGDENFYILRGDHGDMRYELKSAHKPQWLKAETVGRVLGDEIELWSEEAYDMIMGRLRMGGKAYWTGTPLGFNWMFDRIYKRFLNGDKSVGFVKSITRDNPLIDDKWYENIRKNYSEKMFQQELMAEFVSFQGLVYPAFDMKKHIISMEDVQEKIGTNATAVMGIDWGFNDPFAVVVMLMSPVTGNVVVIDELYETETILDDMYMLMRKMQYWDRLAWVFYDPSRPDYARECQVKYKMTMTKADNSIHAGLDYVRKLIEQDRFYVVGENCPHTLQELKKYQYKDARAGKNKTEKPVDAWNHACLIGGTMVSTSKGNIPIKDIKINDYVYTLLGLRRVTDACKTAVHAQIVQLTLSSGVILKGTPDHPVFVMGEGFKSLDAIHHGDKIVSWEKLKHYYMTESYGDAIHIPAIEPVENISTHIHQKLYTIIYTGISGLKRKVVSLQDMLFITEMAIQEIIKSLIWSVLPNNNMMAIMRNNQHLTKGAILSGYDHWLQSGINQIRVDNGTKYIIKNILNKYGISRYANSVFNAINHIKFDILAHQEVNFVHTNANLTGGVNPAKKTKDDIVHSAIEVLLQTNSKKLDSVVDHVVDVIDGGKADVYNIVVDEAHHYFANGILVSNCDAIRYGIYSYYLINGDDLIARESPKIKEISDPRLWNNQMWREYAQAWRDIELEKEIEESKQNAVFPWWMMQ
jgi:hypothetical protein